MQSKAHSHQMAEKQMQKTDKRQPNQNNAPQTAYINQRKEEYKDPAGDSASYPRANAAERQPTSHKTRIRQPQKNKCKKPKWGREKKRETQNPTTPIVKGQMHPQRRQPDQTTHRQNQTAVHTKASPNKGLEQVKP